MAVVVHAPEVGLRAGVPLVGGQPVPPGRFHVVLRDALAGVVPEPEAELRAGNPCLSTRPQRIDLLPDGVRHAGLSVHGDVMSDPILPLAGGSM